MIRSLAQTFVREVVEHSAQPDLTLAALSFCIAACIVIGLRVVIAT